jgi:DNA-binding PadR family transcriptional regulator
MRTSSTTGFALPDLDLRGALDGLREAFAPRSADGADRDVRAAILVELAEQPMHGYQLIQAIQARSDGAWTPTAGSVYPTLQLLADEGLATATQEGERKVYTLTDAGRAAAAQASGDDQAAEHGYDRRRDVERRLQLPKAGAKLAQAMSQVGHSGTDEQIDRAVALVDETRRKLYAILAEE